MKIKKRLTVCILALALIILGALAMTSCGECDHEWEETVVEEATCYKQGTVIKTCKKDSTHVEVVNPTLEHSFTAYVSDGNATCVTLGTETAVCDAEGCTATHSRTTAVLGHSFTAYEFVDATCTLPSCEVALCDNCGIATDSRALENETPATGHSFSDGYICTVCGTAENDMAYVTSYDISAEGDGSVIAELWHLTAEGRKYLLSIKGEGEIRDYTNESPEWIATYKRLITRVVIAEGITYLGEGTFKGLIELVSVNIPDGVTEIPANLFDECEEITEITIPAGVTSIGDYAFNKCKKLAEVEFKSDANLITIGDYAFAECSRLKSFSTPASVTSIGEYAFNRDSQLTDFTVPEGLKYIASSALDGAKLPVTSKENGLITNYKGGKYLAVGENLYAILLGVDTASLEKASDDAKTADVLTIHSATTLIADKLFASVTKVAEIRIEDGNTAYTVSGNCIISGDSVIAAIASSVIPNDGTVTKIAKNAFFGCTTLEAVTIPDNITVIESGAFAGCAKLASVTLPTGITEIPASAFENCSALASITIPAGVTAIGDSAFAGCSKLASISIPEGIATIGSSAFSACKALATVTLPASLELIGESAFLGCTQLTAIVLPENVTVDRYAFAGCTALKNITLPAVAALKDYAFYACTAITAIVIPDTFTELGYSVFGNCTSLKEITLPFIGSDPDATVSSSFAYIFGSADAVPASLAKVTLSSVTEIAAKAFEGCAGIKEIHLPVSVNAIGESAFLGCNSLKGVYISDLVAWCAIDFADYYSNPLYIAKNLYVNSALVSALVIPEGVTKIAYAAFAGSNVTSITLPSTLLTIDEAAFTGCKNVTTLSVPDSVTEIGAHAFAGCSSLETVNLSAALTAINEYTFISCVSLKNLYISASVTDIDISAFTTCSRLINIVVAEENEVYASVDGALVLKSDGTVLFSI